MSPAGDWHERKFPERFALLSVFFAAGGWTYNLAVVSALIGFPQAWGAIERLGLGWGGFFTLCLIASCLALVTGMLGISRVRSERLAIVGGVLGAASFVLMILGTIGLVAWGFENEGGVHD